MRILTTCKIDIYSISLAKLNAFDIFLCLNYMLTMFVLIYCAICQLLNFLPTEQIMFLKALLC